MSAAVPWVWGITLGVVTVVIVPLALYLLHRTFSAARNIERYLRESLEAGRGIASSTTAVAALEQTAAGASSVLDKTHRIRDHGGDIGRTLRGATGAG